MRSYRWAGHSWRYWRAHPGPCLLTSGTAGRTAHRSPRRTGKGHGTEGGPLEEDLRSQHKGKWGVGGFKEHSYMQSKTGEKQKTTCMGEMKKSHWASDPHDPHLPLCGKQTISILGPTMTHHPTEDFCRCPFTTKATLFDPSWNYLCYIHGTKLQVQEDFIHLQGPQVCISGTPSCIQSLYYKSKYLTLGNIYYTLVEFNFIILTVKMLTARWRGYELHLLQFKLLKSWVYFYS